MFVVSQTAFIIGLSLVVALLLLCFKPTRWLLAFVFLFIPSVILYFIGALLCIPFVMFEVACNADDFKGMDSKERKEELKRRFYEKVGFKR